MGDRVRGSERLGVCVIEREAVIMTGIQYRYEIHKIGLLTLGIWDL